MLQANYKIHLFLFYPALLVIMKAFKETSDLRDYIYIYIYIYICVCVCVCVCVIQGK